MKFVRHFLAVASLTAVLLTGMFWYFADQATAPVAPVASANLPADLVQLVDTVVVSDELKADRARTLELLRESCPELGISESGIKERFVERFSYGDFELSRPEAMIIAQRLKESGFCAV